MKLYLVAVEPSADQLGADLVRELRKTNPDVTLVGIGGAHMREQGVPSQMDTDGLAILGITEALKRLPLVYRKIADATERIEAAQPDAVIMLDSYGFMIRLAERLRKRNFDKTLIKYVAPQVWAMRPSRAGRLARLFDFLLTLHPFEAEWFTPLGLKTHYVGNAVFDMDYFSGNSNRLRKQYDLEDRPILSVFFGSRRSEIEQLARPFTDTVVRLKMSIPNLAVVSPVSDSVMKEVGAAAGEDPRMNEIILLPEEAKLDVMACSTAALACSGTVTTQLACAGIPTVVAYRMTGLSYAIVSRMFQPDYISMVNISANKTLMPEFIQGDVNENVLAGALESYLTDQEKRAAMSDALIKQTDEMRGQKGQKASSRAAKAILDILSGA